MNTLATGGVLPDLTLVLDLDPVVGMRRIRDRALDAFEKMDLAFHRRVREGYLEIARSDKNRVVVLDAGREPEVLHADVVRSVDECLARRGGGGRWAGRPPGPARGRAAPSAGAAARAGRPPPTA